MEPISDTEVRSASCGEETREIGVVPLQFGEEIERLMEAAPQEAGSSFTALLELPANQAMELLHSPEMEKPPPGFAGDVWSNCPQIDDQTTYALQSLEFPPTFPSNTALLERASRFSVFAAAEKPTSVPSNSSPNSLRVKSEPADSYSNPNSSSPIVPNNKPNSAKRKERDTKEKCSTKKSKSGGNKTDDGEKLPYVHVRARRGQATDSHSLAERARREKINARMKLLQDLVPGCNKISGTAMVLDEIINHVQSLQRQVEYLSMRLATVSPRTDFNLDSLLAAESGSPVESNFPNMVMPLVWPEGQANGNRQHYQQQLWHLNGLHQPVWARQDNPHLIDPENTLISYDSSANSATLHSDQLKMEL